MRNFSGFPARMKYTPIPNLFFSSLLPQIQDLVELKVTLHVFWALFQKKGYPRFITFSELLNDQQLISSLKVNGSPAEELRRGLQAAVDRGTLLRLKVERGEKVEELYFLNTEADRRAIAKIESGEIQLGGIVKKEPTSFEEKPNIFTLYEQHIGLLTPLIAEDLKEAEKIYPASWIEDAFREAVRLNRRNWKYISKILERWASEGKDYGRAREGPQEDIKPKEYLKRYGQLSKR